MPTAVECVTLDLPGTLTHPFREVEWTLAECADTGLAVVRVARALASGEPGKWSAERYLITEVVHPDPDCRAFKVIRLKTERRGAERYDVEMPARGWPSCSCAGHTYAGTERANRRAGARLSGSLGCKHADTVAAVLDRIGCGLKAVTAGASGASTLRLPAAS